MGGSAIGADLIAAYLAPAAGASIQGWRNYGLPAYAQGPETLVVASSHSGNTEETLSGFETALRRGVHLLAISTGGELIRRAQEAGAPAWRFEHRGQPRAAVGFSFSLLLAAMARLGLCPDQGSEIAAAAAEMRAQASHLRAEVPVVRNPAKRMAGQWMGRWPAGMGAEFLSPAARRRWTIITTIT